jgi:hypothetical protein
VLASTTVSAQPESIASAALRRILEPLACGARIEETDDLRKVLSALERFLPAALRGAYPEDWTYESLDGLFVARAFKIELRTADLVGMCILLTDQNVTPFHVCLRVAAAVDEIEWVHCRLGEQTEDGLLRIPYSATTWRQRLHALDVSAIAWAYEVDLHRSAPVP